MLAGPVGVLLADVAARVLLGLFRAPVARGAADAESAGSLLDGEENQGRVARDSRFSMMSSGVSP